MGKYTESTDEELKELVLSGRKRKGVLEELVVRDSEAAVAAIVEWMRVENCASHSRVVKATPQAIGALSRMPKHGFRGLVALIDYGEILAMRAALAEFGTAAELREAIDRELEKWAILQTKAEEAFEGLDSRMLKLALTGLFCDFSVYGQGFIYSEESSEADIEILDGLLPKIKTLVPNSSSESLLRYRWPETIVISWLVTAALNRGELTAKLLLALHQHPCIMVQTQVVYPTITPEQFQPSEVETLIAKLRPKVSHPHATAAMAAARHLLQLGVGTEDILANWTNWPTRIRAKVAVVMAQCDIDVGYEYLSSIVDQPDGGATGELWDLGTSKAVKALMGARERVTNDVPHFVRSLACIEQPEVLEALQELLNSASAEMKKEATEWLARLAQKAEGVEDWQTLSKASKKRNAAKVASTTKEVLDQGNEHPKAELAKSGRSKCLVCREKIESGTLRIGVLRMVETPRFSKKSTSWLHPACWSDCAELSAIDDLDQALRENSPEVWTANLFPLSGLVSKAEWPKFTSWLEEQEEECSHDEESYLNWFEKGTGAQAKAARLYAVMGDVAGTGPCACAASVGTFEYPAVEAK